MREEKKIEKKNVFFFFFLKIAAFILDPLVEVRSGPEVNAFKVTKGKLQF